MEGTKVSVGEGGGDEGHFKVIVGYGGDGEGGAVDGDAAFFYHIFGELRRQVETERVPMFADFPVDERGGGIDMPLDDVAAEAAGDGEGALQVDWVAEGSFALMIDDFAKVGGYDVEFRYHEGQDLAHRLREAGVKIMVTGDIVCTHLDIDVRGKARHREIEQSAKLFYRKHHIKTS